MNEPDWKAATELILAFEGFRPFPYDDKRPNRRWFRGMPIKGTLTIGFGITDPAVVHRFVESGGEISEEEALADFERVLPSYWQRTSGNFTTELNPNQCAALTSLSYNAGPAGIRQKAPTLLDAINERRFEEAAELWKTSIIRAGSEFETGLRRRRAAESALFAKPPSGGSAGPGDLGLRTSFTYVFDEKDFLWLGAERIHTRCASADVLEGLTRTGQITGLGPKSREFHEFLTDVARNAGFTG